MVGGVGVGVGVGCWAVAWHVRWGVGRAGCIPMQSGLRGARRGGGEGITLVGWGFASGF